jgi:hypothetical protein
VSREHLDALIESYLVQITRIPTTVVEDGKRIFGFQSDRAQSMKDEIERLCEVQADEGIVPYSQRAER